MITIIAQLYLVIGQTAVTGKHKDNKNVDIEIYLTVLFTFQSNNNTATCSNSTVTKS